MNGGGVLVPVSVVSVPPKVGSVALGWPAKAFIASGAAPPLRTLFLAHGAPFSGLSDDSHGMCYPRAGGTWNEEGVEEGVMWRDLAHIPDLVYSAGAHRVWLTDDRGAPNDGPDSPWDSTPHRVRDVTADLIDAPGHGDVLTLLRLPQDRYSSVEEDEEVVV